MRITVNTRGDWLQFFPLDLDHQALTAQMAAILKGEWMRQHGWKRIEVTATDHATGRTRRLVRDPYRAECPHCGGPL